MPPANSPSETQPSTPPPYALATSNSSLSSHPYLQQLEEAISTPVPDLASTLTTPETRPRSERRRIQTRSSDRWDGRTILHLTQNDDQDPQIRQHAIDRAGNEEAMDRMQSELDQWQSERNRLRSILYNQQNRQSLLEEQNHRLREQRSRLQEEHTRLHEQSHRPSDQEARMRDDLASLREAQSNLSNLASAITQVGRDSYNTTGAGPSRQRLYDWAATTRHYGRLNDTEHHGQGSSHTENMSSDVDSAPRRELERALRNYRVTRSALRSGRQPGSDLGAVPTASALRAYWNEEPPEPPAHYRPEDSSNSRTPFALSEFVEQHRNERQRQHLDVIRRQNEQRRHENQAGSSHHAGHWSRLHTSDAFIRIRNTIKYLSALRHVGAEQGLELARSMGLDSLHEYADATSPSYLPLSVESLPLPQPSSWLLPGMTWHGLQSTDREPARPAILTRRQRRDALGVSIARSRLAADRSSSLVPSEFIPTRPPLDTERYISSLMQDSEGRWGFDNATDHDDLPGLSSFDPLSIHQPLSHTGAASATADVDHWPVTVTLHSVDFDTMTVSGTMRASQLPDKVVSSPLTAAPNLSDPNQDMKSMESYFLGEIVDFRHHTLETCASSPFSSKSPATYKSGGVDVDARYWARLGPFKREIERQSYTRSRVSPKLWDGKTKVGEKYVDSSGAWRDEDREKVENEAEEAMARCLGDSRWLEEKLGRKKGEWMLMRWKEKCFVDPIIASPRSKTGAFHPSIPNSTSQSNTSSSDRRTMTMTDSSSAQWGLTISGFYYIALNRITGELDGLYFDPGSQPFQCLQMVPVDSGKTVGPAEEKKDAFAAENASMSGLGVKKCFPVVEFR